MAKLFTFDAKLSATFHVPAKSEAEARHIMSDVLDCADANFGCWPDGSPILAEASLAEDPVLTLLKKRASRVNKMKRYAIDPADFSHGQWEEMAAWTTLVPVKYEFKSEAKPLNRPKKDIRLAAIALDEKAIGIANGELGEEFWPGQNAEWILDLHNAADQLLRLIGETPVNRKAIDDADSGEVTQ